MSTQANELDDTEALYLLVGQLVCSDSNVQTLGQVLAWVSLGDTPETSAAGSNPDNAASAQTDVTPPALTMLVQPSNAGGTGL